MNKKSLIFGILLILILSFGVIGIYTNGFTTISDTDSTETIGYWNGMEPNDTIHTNADGSVPESELEDFINRSIARTEVIRNEPFQEDVTVEIESREEFREENPFTTQLTSYQEWSDIVWSGILIVPRQESVMEIQNEHLNENVLAYYLIQENKIVIVAESTEQESYMLNERTMIHELSHALQDQRMGLDNEDLNSEITTVRQSQLALIEGEARYFESELDSKCRTEWDCINVNEYNANTLSTGYSGLDNMSTLPYTLGESYVSQLDEPVFDSLDEVYESETPVQTQYLLHPNKDGDRQEIVYAEDISNRRWNTYESRGLDGRETMGAAGIGVILQHYEQEHGVQSRGSDQDSYRTPVTESYVGDSLIPYYDSIGRTGFVWTTVWDSETGAQEFASIYSETLENTNATVIEEPEYEFPDDAVDSQTIYSGGGEFQGAYSIVQNGNMVVITQAPVVEDLSDIRSTQIDPVVVGEYKTEELDPISYDISKIDERNTEPPDSTGPLITILQISYRIGIIIAFVFGYIWFRNNVDLSELK